MCLLLARHSAVLVSLPDLIDSLSHNCNTLQDSKQTLLRHIAGQQPSLAGQPHDKKIYSASSQLPRCKTALSDCFWRCNSPKHFVNPTGNHPAEPNVGRAGATAGTVSDGWGVGLLTAGPFPLSPLRP